MANEFLSVLREEYGWNAPLLTEAMLNRIAADDPFVDLAGAGRVRGRPLAGALETLGPILGISGDVEEGSAEGGLEALSEEDRQKALSLLDGLRDAWRRGKAPWTQEELQRVFRKMFRP